MNPEIWYNERHDQFIIFHHADIYYHERIENYRGQKMLGTNPNNYPDNIYIGEL